MLDRRLAGNGMMAMFFDGALVGTTVIPDGDGVGMEALIGRHITQPGYYTGDIDELRIGPMRSPPWIALSSTLGVPGTVTIGDVETR